MSSGNRIYVVVFVWLVLLTGATVAASYVSLSRTGNILLGLTIAATKASLVALFFMHLKYDGKADRLFYVVALFPLVLFIVLTVALFPDIGYALSGK